MGKIKPITLVVVSLVVSVGVVLGLVGVTQATWSDNIQGSQGTFTVAEDDIYDGPLYVAAEKVVIDGSVGGGIYCATAELVIRGNVNGDILCAAQTVTFDEAVVNGDVRLAVQRVSITAGIGGSLSTLAQDVEIAGNTQISGDLNGVSQNATIDGSVLGGVVSVGERISINGAVGDNANLTYGRVDIGDNAQIAGDLNYSARSEQSLDNSDRVEGEVNFIASTASSGSGGWLGGAAVVLGSLLVTALIVALIMPRFLHRSSLVLSDQPLNTILFGFALVFGAPILAVVLIVTVFAAPLGIVALLSWMATLLLSGAFAAYYIGAVLLRNVSNVPLRAIGGALVLIVMLMIPLLNILVLLATAVVGSGMLVATVLNGYRRPSYTISASQSNIQSKNSKE